MNKQIKNLWEESQQWNGSDDGRGGLKIHESVEKFAELIVFECSKVIVFGGYRNHAVGEKTQLTPVEIATMIKEHFGVTE